MVDFRVSVMECLPRLRQLDLEEIEEENGENTEVASAENDESESADDTHSTSEGKSSAAFRTLPGILHRNKLPNIDGWLCCRAMHPDTIAIMQ
ncbi:hypothetical protein BaRGS_00022523 [Batillaria attramentaria]|uniref:Uncharacterized protein n=1 Tax=Batillaria attramentaria TaxID=370345 RepID=A0ABD0KGT7_9CAEN